MAKPDMKQLVSFIIPAHRIRKTATEEAAYRALIEEVFGECLGRGDWDDLNIVCRLDQFGLFLLRRHSMRIQNMFAELEARLVPTVKPNRLIDVSKN